jgi:outer membrane protein
VEKWTLPLSIIALVLALIGIAGNLTGKVAVVDMAKVAKESPKAQLYEKQLADKYQQLTKNLAQKKGLSEAEKEKQQAAAYEEYLKTKEQLELKLEREVAASVRKIARSRRLSVVLYKEAVRWGGVDITPQVTKALR